MNTIVTTPRIVDADTTPRIGDLVPGAVVFRWATARTQIMTSELPCHPDQMVSVHHDVGSRSVQVDQLVVCRRCGTSYAATPVPANAEQPRPRIVYRHTGIVGMSRQRRRLNRF